MMPIVYWLLEPLAFPVWHHQITELGDPELVKKFKWRKELRFMGLYQKKGIAIYGSVPETGGSAC